MREEEWIRMTDVRVADAGLVIDRGDQSAIALRRWTRRQIRISDQPLRNALCIDIRNGGQRTRDQQLRYADAKASRDQLDANELPRAIQLVEPREQSRDRLVGRQTAQRQQTRLDPQRESGNIHGLRRRGQQQRNRFRKIADRLIAFLEQPFGYPALSEHELPQRLGRDELARTATGQEVHGPRGIGRLGVAEVIDHCRLLRVVARRRVELHVEIGEALHSATAPVASSISSSPYSVANSCASSPCSRSQRTITLVDPWVTNTRSAPVSVIAFCNPGQSA